MCVAAPTSSLWTELAQASKRFYYMAHKKMIARSSSSSPQEPRSLLTGLRIEAAQPQEAKESMQEASSLQQLSYTGLLPYGFCERQI